MCNEKENNVMRHKYKPLSDAEKKKMADVKDIGLNMYEFVDSIGASVEIEVAKQKIEEAVMWATKHITK